MRLTVSPEDAQGFIQRAKFRWYQRFQLASGVYTPGVNDIEACIRRMDVPEDLTGKTVLDVGANNGGVCFEMEKRGAARVLGIDVMPEDTFGFGQLRAFLESDAEYVRASVYDTTAIDGPVDVVFCLGVLYHLRHPLLALDNLRRLTRGCMFIETAVADWGIGEHRELPVARFYRKAELNGDTSNWFAPSVACLVDWCWSSGFEPTVLVAWPKEAPRRCLVRAVPLPGEPEYRVISYERSVQATVAW